MARINLTGPSGMGKTTLAKWISETYQIPFISGSYSDLVPETAKMTHRDMISQDAKIIQLQDTQVLNLRRKAFDSFETMVSDRSYLDSAAYFINKLSHRIPQCETEPFIEICRELTCKQCDKVIFIPAGVNHLKDWMMEDNQKRSTNLYFHIEISQVIYWILIDLWGAELEYTIDINDTQDAPVYRVYMEKNGETFSTDIMIIPDSCTDFEKRKEFVDCFLRM